MSGYHKSIINLLWDELEKLRDDISIFYITHDLDFAKERFGSKKIWIKSFDGKESWDFQEINFENNKELFQKMISETIEKMKRFISDKTHDNKRNTSCIKTKRKI